VTGLAAISVGSKLLGIRSAISGAFTWLTANIAHLLAGLLAISLLFGLWERHEAGKWHRAYDSSEAARKADQAQWNAQVAAARAATAAALKQGQDTAHDAQTYHDQLAAAHSELADYIAAHRVRQPTARPATPASSGSGVDPAVHADAATVPTVAVPDSVLNIADADYVYAAACYKLGQDLVAKGLAVKGE
jgi:hypothetical protein